MATTTTAPVHGEFVKFRSGLDIGMVLYEIARVSEPATSLRTDTTTPYSEDIPQLALHATCDEDVQIEEIQFEKPAKTLVE
jgi:hypothetical protein